MGGLLSIVSGLDDPVRVGGRTSRTRKDTKNKNGLITSGPHYTDNQSQVVNNASVGRFVSLTGHKKGLATTQVEAHVPSRDAARGVLGRRTMVIPHRLVD